MQGVRVGEASNTGLPRRINLRPVEGREVVLEDRPELSQADATVQEVM